MSSNDTLINAIIADMQTIQKKHMALEEHEAYEEAEWAEELVAEKKAALEKAQHALHIAEEDLEQANRTYKRIREVPRSQRRGVNFKTNTTLDDRLGFRAKWDTLNNLLKLVGKEQQTLEYLDRPWRAPLETDTPQAQAQVQEVEAPKLIKGSDGLAEMSWARLYVPSPPPSAPAASAAPAPVSEPAFSPPNPVCEAAPSVEEPNTYVPPPRVLDAEQYWPASRCRNLAKEVLREKPSRNHFGLIQQLSSHYKMTPEAFKKKNPIYLIQNVPLLKKILGYSEYRRLTQT
jgi:hypothetical protein